MDAFESGLQKAFSGALYRANDPFWHTNFLPCGIQGVDYALGGGFGYGRITEIFGEWSSGKTMILYYALAQNQRMLSKNGKPGRSILFEAEGAFDSKFYKALGGDPDSLLIYSVDTVEDVFDGIISACKVKTALEKTEKCDVPVAIGWDSIAATGTKHLMAVGMDKRDMSKANLMSAGTQLITTLVKECKIAIIATNQVREKIATGMGQQSSAPHTPGGKGWPFHSSQRIQLAFDGGYKGSLIIDQDTETEIGRWIKGQVVKNKLASPFGKFSIPIYVRGGFDHPRFKGTKTKLGIDLDEALFGFLYKSFTLPSGSKVIDGSSGWFSLNDQFGGQRFRRADWPQVLAEHPELKEIHNAIPTAPPVPPEASEKAESGC